MFQKAQPTQFPGSPLPSVASAFHRFGWPSLGPPFGAWQHGRPPHARVDPFGRWLSTSCDNKICKIFTAADNDNSSPLSLSYFFKILLCNTYSYNFLYHFHAFSSDLIRLHRPSLDIEGQLRRQDRFVTWSAVQSRRLSMSLDEVRSHRSHEFRAMRCFERCCSYDFRRRCGSWKIEIRGLQLALVPHVPHWRDTRGTWTTFRFPKEFAHCIKFFCWFCQFF